VKFKKLLRAMCMVVVPIALITGLTSCVFPQDTHQTEKEAAVGIVHSTAVGLGALLEDIQDEDEQINLIRSFIDPIRFYDDQSGYFYVYNFDCINIAHAIQKNLPGENLYDYQDMKGKYVIRDLAAAAMNGGGFVTYHWMHPVTKKEEPKIGYVEPIPGTDYFIGTGVYTN